MEASTLVRLFQIQLEHVDHVLVTAFIERWYPDTNTFQLPVGDMTVTLHDILRICGLTIDGEAMRRPMSITSLKHEMCQLWNFSSTDVEKWFHKGGITVVELKDKITELIREGGSQRAIASAWMWMFLGCTLFQDKSGKKVKCIYAAFVINHAATPYYAWGTGALAYLYRSLGESSRKQVSGLAGLGPLLHVSNFIERI